MWFSCMDPRFYQKFLQNYGFFFQKKLRYLKYKISTKFHHLLFLFYFFSIFVILFSISPILTCPKIMEFFVVFFRKVRHFTDDFCKILKVLLRKKLICEIFCFQNSAVYYLFFLFLYYFWHFIFNFNYVYLSKNSRNFFVFLFYGLEILLKNFWKSWNIFIKNIDIWNSKFFINFIVYYLFFFLAFW